MADDESSSGWTRVQPKSKRVDAIWLHYAAFVILPVLYTGSGSEVPSDEDGENDEVRDVPSQREERGRERTP